MTEAAEPLFDIDMDDHAGLLSLARAHRYAVLHNLNDPIARQAWSVYQHELACDSPRNTWNSGQAHHPAIYRALCIDPADPTAAYAVLHLRLVRIAGAHLIAAAWPVPAIYEDHLGIDTVLLWNPVDNTLIEMGDAEPLFSHGAVDTIYADPFEFMRAWAEQRSIFWARRQRIGADKWSARPDEITTKLPGAMLMSPADKVQWRGVNLAGAIDIVGDAAPVKRAIMRELGPPRMNVAQIQRAA